MREIPAVGWTPTAPGTGMQLVRVLNGTDVGGVNFGNKQRTDGAIAGIVFVDANHNGVRDAGERGLAGITVYLDLNNDGVQDAGEPTHHHAPPTCSTRPPSTRRAPTQFTHLPAGTYHVREVVPDLLSATPAAARAAGRSTSAPAKHRRDVNFADVYRANEIHGVGLRRREPQPRPRRRARRASPA